MKRLIVLSFDKNESYAENNCILALLLGGAVPNSARDILTTRHPTRITPSPSLGQTGAPVVLSYGCQQLRLPLLPSSPSQFTSCHVPQNPLSNVFSFITDAIGYPKTNISISSRDDPTNPTTRYTAVNPVLCVALTVQNTSVVGAGAELVFVASSLNTSFTAGVAPAPVNLTAPRQTGSWVVPHEGRTRCRQTAVAGMATVIAGMVRWMQKSETFVLPYPMQFSSVLQRPSCRTDHDLFSFFVTFSV